MRNMLFAVLFVLSSLSSGFAVAQEQTLSPQEQIEARLVLETARNLISYGETNEDALALVTGAKLLASVPGRVLSDDETGDTAESATGFDVEAVLAKAEEIAAGDANITAIAAEVRTLAEEQSRAVCYWQYYCYWNGYCEYAWACW